MKIQKFNEVKDPLIGEEMIPVEVKVRFKTSKSRNYDGYSLRVTIDGVNGEPILLGQGIAENDLILIKNSFLARISNLHNSANKYNI